MRTIVNIGTSEGNIQGVEFDKPFDEITERDVLIQAMKKFKDTSFSIIGWVDVTPKLNKMNHIEKMHLEAMKKVDKNLTGSLGFFITGTASKSAEITEQVAIEFAVWLNDTDRVHTICKNADIDFTQSDRTIAELLYQEFLKEKEHE